MKYITSNISAIDSPYLSNKNTGLGNVLFQIASVCGIADSLGCTATFPSISKFGKALKERFNFDHGTTIFRNVPTQETSLTVFNHKVHEGNMMHKQFDYNIIQQIQASSDNTCVYGYLENDIYFNHIKDSIKQMFSPDEGSLKIISEKYGELLQGQTVSIHFRGNEYKTAGCAGAAGVSIEYNYDYYRRAIEYIKEHVTNPTFLIFTDDKPSIDFTKLNLDGSTYYFVENNQDYIELSLMSMCKHNIMSFSTFSWWGSFLNSSPDKIVLFDKNLYYPYLRTSTFIGI